MWRWVQLNIVLVQPDSTMVLLPTMESEGAFLAELQALHRSGELDVNAYISLAGAPPHTYMYVATRQGWCTALRWLLDHGADPHKGQLEFFEAFDPAECMRTPLYIAAFYGHIDAAVILLDAGAQVDACSFDGHRPLHLAASRGWVGTCKLLLSRGASLDARTHAGRDAEAYALCINQPGLAALFAAVRAAGGWQPYLDAPRRELLALRRELPSLRERGRATPSDDRLYERLFHDTRVPEEIFIHVFSYWRTPRDFTYTPRDA